MALHRFLTQNQTAERDSLLTNLQRNHLVLISDYAEKHAAREFEEIQSLHWHSVLITLFCMVAFFVVTDEFGEEKKVKLYFGFITEKPEQDQHFAAECRWRVLKWLQKKFKIVFESIDLLSDRCALQFCSRKVFGALAESRRNLCVNHDTAEPLCSSCPQVSIHFSCAGHGKCEVDHVGALLKTNLRKEELNRRPLRNITDIAAHLQTLNFVDLRKTRLGREDSKGFFYSGLHTEAVSPQDISEPPTDWERIEGTRDLHQLHTTNIPGELLVRESSCYSCPACSKRDFLRCSRIDELGPIESVMVQRTSSVVSSARAATRTRSGHERHRNEIADLANPGSVIAISRGQRQDLNFVQVTKGRGQSSDENSLQGKVLVKIQNSSNRLTSTGAKLLTFDVSLVRSPPLAFRSSAAVVDGKKLTICEINENEFNSLVANFLL